jgi:hypothetical protein
MTKSLRWVRAKIGPRAVDFLAIFVAGVASVAIIINAVFLQSDRGTKPSTNFINYLPSLFGFLFKPMA